MTARGKAARGPRGRWALGLVALAVAVVGLRAFDPAAGALGRLVMCPFYGLTGLHCPGCGTLRALRCLLHLDLPGALAFNPLTVLCLGVLAVDGALRWFAPRRRAAWLRTPALLRAVRSIPAAVGLFWVLRNIPVAPLQMLAPH